MDKAQNREWDSGKPAIVTPKKETKIGTSNQEPPTVEDSQPLDSQGSPQPTEQPVASNQWIRGSGPPRGVRGRGRGRSRGGRGAHTTPHKGKAVTEGVEGAAESQEVGDNKEAGNSTPSAPS